MRIGRVVLVFVVFSEIVFSLLILEVGEFVSYLNWGGERGRVKLSIRGVGWV